jgi:hypothetical protein
VNQTLPYVMGRTSSGTLVDYILPHMGPLTLTITERESTTDMLNSFSARDIVTEQMTMTERDPKLVALEKSAWCDGYVEGVNEERRNLGHQEMNMIPLREEAERAYDAVHG